MSANAWVKILSFLVLFGVFYFSFKTPLDQQQFEQKLLSQPPSNQFSETFEGIDRVSDLFSTDLSRWHQITNQNNELKFLKNSTKNCLTSPVDCTTNANQNHISLSQEIKRRGKNALKLTAQAAANQPGRKSAIALRKHGLNLKQGDEVYITGWFYLEADKEKGTPNTQELTLLGLRSANSSWRYRKEPGRFFLLERNNYLASDLLYWIPRPDTYRQSVLEEVALPFNKWTQIKIYMKISAGDDGLVQIWQDNKKVLFHPGITIPENKTILSILEIGILNHRDPKNSQTLYLDELRVSDKPLFKL